MRKILLFFVYFFFLFCINIDVSADVFSITIPKNISLSKNSSLDYFITASGTGGCSINIIPDNNLILNSNNKKSIECKIIQDENIWNNQELLNSTTKKGTIILNDSITAGKWIGFFDFNINITYTEYNINYYLDNGINNINNPNTYINKTNIVLLDPIKQGYEFKGWYIDNNYTKEITQITITSVGDLNLYAKWIPKISEYTIEYYTMNTDGVSYSLTEYETKTAYANEIITILPKSYIGFEYDKNNENTIEEQIINEDNSTIFKFYYNRNIYDVILNKENGIKETIGEGKYYYGEEVEITAECIDGYTFKEWQTYRTGNLEKINSKIYKFTMGSSDISFKAICMNNTYTIVYNSSNGDGEMNNSIHYYNIEKSLNKNLYRKSGYIFNGWIKDNDSTILFSDMENVVNLSLINNDIINLYALWECPFTYKINKQEMTITGLKPEFSYLEEIEIGSTYNISGNMYNVVATDLNAFRNNTILKNVKIDPGVTVIGKQCYQYGKNIKNIILSDTITEIKREAFEQTGIEELYIPDSVTTIGVEICEDCTSLKTVRLSNKMTYIPDRMFYKCTNLESIIIPKSIKTFNIECFYNCSSLKDIYYTGTKNEWDKITKDLYLMLGNWSINSAIIHYNYIEEE